MRPLNIQYIIINIILGITFSNVEATVLNTLHSEKILNEIRGLMRAKDIQAYIVPMSDAHQSEYISESDSRIKFLTNFTGSGGEVVITEDKAALWTDTRYHQQADQQLDLNFWNVMKSGLSNVPNQQKWLIDNLPNNSRIGVDPLYISSPSFKLYSKALQEKQHNLIVVRDNLVDQVWNNKPAPIRNPIFPLPIKFSGNTIDEKVNLVRSKFQENEADFIIIPTLDNIAWLLNLRGSDIKYNPVFFSYIILTIDEFHLFIDENRITYLIENHFKSENISIYIHNYENIFVEIPKLVNETKGKILIEKPVSQAIVELIPENRITIQDTVARIKSVKNEIEANGMLNAHIRDAFALIQYMHWLNETIDNDNVTEYTGAEKLSSLRGENENFIGLSFAVISAVGSNAAMPHYSPANSTAKQITRNEIYLVDSGGQYWDGTTDVTRTMHFGTPTDFEKECFTRVLKGFIALTTSVFPTTTPLSYFDYVARRSLWQAGLDYGHGTGHGVGAFLYVHEYPPSIDKNSNTVPLVNMFTSNEPGFYLDGQFGIRIEDVIQVVESDIDNAFFGKGALTFKSITYAPLQTKMIKTSLLNKEEAKFVNDFNQRIINTIGPMLIERNLTETYDWLLSDTIPIVASG